MTQVTSSVLSADEAQIFLYKLDTPDSVTAVPLAMKLILYTFMTLLSVTVRGTLEHATNSRCDPEAKGAGLGAKRRAAIHDFAHIMFVEQDVQKAFDAYMPGEYIQHNPTSQPGRQWTIDYLTEVYSAPDITVSNVTAWAGEGFGTLHYRVQAPSLGIDWAIMDRLRFEGTCFVEHWDVMQPIYGNETNPIAFF